MPQGAKWQLFSIKMAAKVKSTMALYKKMNVILLGKFHAFLTNDATFTLCRSTIWSIFIHFIRKTDLFIVDRIVQKLPLGWHS